MGGVGVWMDTGLVDSDVPVSAEIKNALSSHPESWFLSTYPRDVSLYAQRSTFKDIQCSTVWNSKTLETSLNAQQKENK